MKFEVDIKTIEKVLPKANPQDLLNMFYEKTKQYSRYQYSETHIVDGVMVPFEHVIFEIDPPKGNSFTFREWAGVEYKYWRTRNDREMPRASQVFVPMKVTVFTPQEGVVFIKAEFTRFFENMVTELLSSLKSAGEDAINSVDADIHAIDTEIEERRDKVVEYLVQGRSDKWIANKLHVSLKTIQRDKYARGMVKPRKKGHSEMS